MALPSGSNKIQYVVTEDTDEFNFPYKYWEENEIKVSVVNLTTGIETVLDFLSGDYTVEATNGDSRLGALVTTAVPYDNHRVTIERVVVVESEADFVRGDGLPPDALNSEFDKSAARQQQFEDELDRHLLHPSSDPPDLNYESPTVELRRNKAVGYDDDGNIVVIDLAETGTLSVNASTGLSLISNVISGKVDNTSLAFIDGNFAIKDDGVTSRTIADNAIVGSMILNATIPLGKLVPLNNLVVVGNVTGAGNTPAEVEIKNENNMASDDPSALATQASIKAYIDSIDTTFIKFTGYDGGGTLALVVDDDTETQFNIALFEGAGLVPANIRSIMIRVYADVDADTGLENRTEIEASLPDDPDDLIEWFRIEGGSLDPGARVASTGTLDLPINKDQVYFKIKATYLNQVLPQSQIYVVGARVRVSN
jgi:hypothetical protein